MLNAQSTEELEALRQTHWHKDTLQSYQNIIDGIPAVIETGLALWALRIKRSQEKQETKHLSHKMFFVMHASHYAIKDGISQPDGQVLTFLVSAESRSDAMDRVIAELNTHGLNGIEWSIGSTTTPLILEAGKAQTL